MSYLAELLPSIGKLHVKIYEATESSRFEFKSENGDFLLRVYNPDLQIKMTGLGIKLLPKQYKIENQDKCIIFSF